MRFAWDDAKDAANRRKHGFPLAVGIAVVEDPLVVDWIDRRYLYDEERICSLGIYRSTVLMAVYTFRPPDICRLISVRKATPNEAKRYYLDRTRAW